MQWWFFSTSRFVLSPRGTLLTWKKRGGKEQKKEDAVAMPSAEDLAQKRMTGAETNDLLCSLPQNPGTPEACAFFSP